MTITSPGNAVLERIFVDTAFVIAVVNERDQYHQQARELADRFEGHPMLVTDAVLLEKGNAFSRNFKPQAVEIIGFFMTSDEVEIIHLSHALFDKAFALYKKYQDKEWSLGDCFSFIVMREQAVKQALTFDQHFIQAGFTILV
jgi:predicted nucleic acid-binding protein